MKEYREDFTLSPAVIDKMSGICAETLAEAKVDKKDILRIRLSLEEILGVWLERLGAVNIRCSLARRFKQDVLGFSVDGPRLDPSIGGERNAEFFLTSRLLADAGLALSYLYKNGRNCLVIHIPAKRRPDQLKQIFIAFAAAAICGLFCRMLPTDTQQGLISITKPLFDTMFRALRAASTPLIFLALCTSISDIGDISVFNRLGKRIICRFLAFDLVAAVFAACFAIPFLPVEYDSKISASNFSAIYDMILNIVPSNVISPFQDGNALQLLFLSMVLGIVLLLLGSRVSPVKSMLSMLNEVANFIMIYISRFLPLFIFLSVFNIFLSELGIIGNDIKGFIKMPVISILGCYLIIIFYLLAVSLRFRVSPILLSKKLIPVHLTALTTASSIAAFAVTVDTCRRFFGISKNACNFAVPLGQVIFKPGGIISVFIVVACLAEIYGIAITPLWIVNAVIIVALVAIATPPIPGAGLMAFSVIFTQLSLPPEAIAIAAVAESVLDFTLTACSVSCLQLELVFGMNGIGLLDKKILRGSVD